MSKLKEKVAIVTAATRGIGFVCAQKLAEAGASVYLAVRRVEDTESICEDQRKYGLQMNVVYFDATEEETADSMVKTVAEREGRIDVLVNNFGTGRPDADLDLVSGDEEAFFEIIRLNLGSVYRVTKRVLPYMRQAGGGSIINISSIGGVIPDITRIGYGVSKAAVNNITKQIALQYARDNVRCNAVLPGLTQTDAATYNMSKEFVESFLSHVPLNRVGVPEDVANAVLFFAGDDSSYITGHILDVAGGYGLGTPQYAEWSRS